MIILKYKKWYNQRSIAIKSIVKGQWSMVPSRGFITLISVLVVGAVGIAVTLSIILLGVGFGRTSFAVSQSSQAKALANACAEEGLEKIRESASFTGSGNLSMGQGTCTYTVTSQGGSNRTITSSGTVGTIVRKTSTAINAINPYITPTSWQEIP